MVAPGAGIPGHHMNMGMPSEAAMMEALLASGGLGNMGFGGMGSLPGHCSSACAHGRKWQLVSYRSDEWHPSEPHLKLAKTQGMALA